jgi:hypothetical protein
MALDELIRTLEEKLVLGEYGAFTRPYIVLDVDEYQDILKALKAKQRGRQRKVPHEQIRA